MMVDKFIFNEPINNIVEKRKSVRTYKKDEVADEDIYKINKYISKLKGPFNSKVIFKIVDNKDHINGAKLGTYGIIKGANKYIVAKVKRCEYDLEQLGYEMENLILYVTSLGLGTCWVGGTFKRGQFIKAMEVSEDEILPVISPIGYEATKKSFIDKTMRKLAKCDKRKSWSEIFFLRDFSCPLTEYCTLDNYKQVLENLRLSPSALNKQPWRIVKSGENFHFFMEKSKDNHNELNYDVKRIDMGIAMCHFDLTCKEIGINGSFKVVNHEIREIPENLRYLISWIRE